ncbi:hypothetical protein KZX45_00450 [Georgenia sp. EYE_87]|uniref:HGxxPAAW family protein n=1 Tax=Georgenia sp. EYE_87 TaxID=2853448 RepID=UPI002005413F|nr:HGxxPAAW family protein [Georgenia sp. EYE_87]MCK6209013.1 hypothetical protein [Georgenia sp. EYE_87]
MVQTPEPHTYSLPPAAPYANHGRTKAAWVLMLGVCLGFLLAGVGLIISNDVIVIASVVITLGSIVISVIMRGMGLGQPVPRAGDEAEKKDWYSA